MATRWLCIGGVIGLAAFAQGLFLGLPEAQNEIVGPAVVAGPLTLGGLLAFWAVFGGRPTPWRFVAAILLMLGWLWIWIEWLSVWVDSEFSNEGPLWYGLAFVQLIVCGSISMLVRWLGIELTDTTMPEPSPAESERPWFQFSLRSILSWTAAVAVVLSALHYFPRETMEYGPPAFFVVSAILAGSAITCATIWFALGTWVTFLRGAAVVVVAVAAVGGIFVALDFNEGLAISFFVASQVVVLSLQFWLIRTAGYRLIWRRRVRV